MAGRYGNEKKRLLIPTDAFTPRWDGIARFLHEIIPELTDEFDVEVIAPLFPGFEGWVDKEKRYKIIRVKSSRIRVSDYYFTRFAFSTIKRAVKKADIVWTQAIMPMGVLGILLAKHFDKPLVATIHSFEWELARDSMPRWNPLRLISPFVVRRLSRFFYNKASRIIVPDEEAKEKLIMNGIKAEIKVAHLGVDVEKFSPTKSKEAAKKKLGIPPSKKVIGYTGRIGREKDLATLYRAFLRVANEHDDVLLMVVGSGIRRIEAMFKRAPNIMFVGNTNNVKLYLDAMDIYVLPSLTETSSLSTMEAMACAIPVIVTPVGHVKHYIKEKYNGMFFPKGNYLVLSLKLLALLKNEKLMKKLGRNARETILEEYNFRKNKEKIISLLREATNG